MDNMKRYRNSLWFKLAYGAFSVSFGWLSAGTVLLSWPSDFRDNPPSWHTHVFLGLCGVGVVCALIGQFRSRVWIKGDENEFS
ncbi:hypothetical protein HTZ77_18510 [Nonomuraea sp. SMC257]|uniref:Uncharacterized protein n=1 Tax=Nonomuraea montanisoli TaxID=2741721 RepID=A0A7Y6M3N2_9ACTN|nr:hypothetical protein [Nonomuraea montanisoli]NUW33407.1 hypothetical protein [Nonomuraea montanisoli]